MLVVILLLFGLWGSGPAREAPPGPMLVSSDPSRVLLEEGRDALMGFRLDRADARFRDLARRPDGAVAGQFHLGLSAFFRYFIHEDEAWARDFMARSDTLKALLDDVPEGAWRDYLRGEAALQRALVRAKQRRYLKAAWEARSAYRTLTGVRDRYPAFYEPYKGLGMLYLALGALPGRYRRFLSMMGYTGTIREGVAALELAAERSTFNTVEARIVLGMADVLLNESRGDGPARFRVLMEERPENPLFAYLYGYAMMENRRSEEAERALRRAVDAGAVPEAEPLDYADYYLGLVLFNLHHFEEAGQWFGRYLERHKGPALRAMATLHRGMALEMTGRRAAAEEAYHRVRATREYDSDVFAEREARRLLKEPLGPAGRRLLLGRTAYAAGQYTAAREHLVPLTTHDTAVDESMRAAARFWLGRVCQAEGDTDGALEAFTGVAAAPGDRGRQWGAWSRYYLAELTLARGDTLAARRHLDDALGWGGDFDYHQTLEQNARALMERIDSGK